MAEPLIFDLNQFENKNELTDEVISSIGEKNLNKDYKSILPNISEPSLVRHFTRLSQKNFCIDTQSYPLGSCTMKYNPKLHEWAARLSCFSELHPLACEDVIQEALKIIFDLQNWLSILGGFKKVSMAPSAGAHGEFSGLAMMQKAFFSRGEKRKFILVPKSAHGTNPATAAFFSLEVKPLDIGDDGTIILSQVANLMNKDCVGIMLTNPNTLGIFEKDQEKISQIIHEKGGFVYGDGANFNALMGQIKPGSLGIDVMHFNLHKTMTTPHGGGGPGCGAIGANGELAKYLPLPLVEKRQENYVVIEKDKNSIGRIRSFFGNFGMMVRAWVYMQSLGLEGLTSASKRAVFNANYLRERLEKYYHLPYKTECLHEVVFSDQYQQQNGINALDIAKRLIDYDIHPPTIYFPLIVKGALMIEPTETESLSDLDKMVNAFINVAKEAKENTDILKNAPHTTKIGRLDEAKAAKNLVLTYQHLFASQKDH